MSADPDEGYGPEGDGRDHLPEGAGPRDGGATAERTSPGTEIPTSVHPSAIVEPGATLGPGTKVWHFCHVRSGARVGAGSVLGQNVYVGGAVRVGDGCRIQNNVSLYDGVELDDAVFVGPSVVFTNVKRPRAFRSQRASFAATRVGRGATLGANATVVCGGPRPLRIGAYSFVGAGAVVTRDVPDHALVVGAPARRRGWVCRCGGDLAAVDEDGDGPAGKVPTLRWGCAACGDLYLEEGGERLVAARGKEGA